MTNKSTPYVVPHQQVTTEHDILDEGEWVAVEAVFGSPPNTSWRTSVTLRSYAPERKPNPYGTEIYGMICVRDRKPSQPQSLRERLEEIAKDGWFRADDLIDTFAEWLTSDEVREVAGVAIKDAQGYPYPAQIVLSAIAEYARKGK